MLTIVGGGPGPREFLTESAVMALDRAQIIFLESPLRQTLGDSQEWLAKAKTDAIPPHRGEREWAQSEMAWVVPGTPALYGPLESWMAGLPPQDLSHIRIISGIPIATAALDREGVFLPAHVIIVQDSRETPLLYWRDGRWEGSKMAKALSWAKHRPLSGRRVVLLRASTRLSRVVRWFEDWGAQVDLYPVSRLTEPENLEAVDRAIHRVTRYDWVIFTSVEALTSWFQRMRQAGVDVRGMRAKIGVVGPETALALRERGFIPTLMPQGDYSQEGLIHALQEEPLRGALILFPGGDRHRALLAEELRARGALVDEVALYRNVMVPLPLALHHAIRTEQPHAVLYTASSQVEYLVEQLSSDDRDHLAHIPAFSIGPLTSRTLKHYGIEPAGEALEPSLRLLAEAVRDYYAAPS